MKYRQEIDGLRAIAVLSVILFHANFTLFGGGFVGVDVFFVISGYLITSIIIKELDQQKFSLINFYLRRARRILPALFFVVFTTIPLSLMLMTPWQFKSYAKSLVAVAYSVSNFLFWRESDYFGGLADEKPLLHTWSLAVEEQYYMFFPLSLILLWKFGKKPIFIITMVSAIGGLLLSEYGWRYFPDANFYLAPTRIWELLVGSLCAFLLTTRTQPGNNLLAASGLMMIIISIFWFDKYTPFPSFYTLLPVIGTALIIMFATSATLAGRLLSVRFMVGIGLISYSAYLWHQPLFAFARIWNLSEPSVSVMLLLSVTSLGLAYLSWRFVEQPARIKPLRLFPTSKSLIISTSLAVFVLTAFGLIGYYTNGFDGRHNKTQLEILAFQEYDLQVPYRQGSCLLGRKISFSKFSDDCYAGRDLMVIGDSHAAAMSFGLRQYFKITQLTKSSCPPLFQPIDINKVRKQGCLANNHFIWQKVEEIKPEILLLHANWSWYFDVADVERKIKQTLEKIRDISPNTKIMVVGGVPQWPPSLPQSILKYNLPLNEISTIPAFNSKVHIIDNALAKTAKQAGVVFVSLLDRLCVKDECIAAIGNGEKKVPFAWDRAHLTKEGSVHVANILRKHPLLREISGK